MKLVVLALGLTATSVAALAGGWSGVWCEGRQTISIDDWGIGFNEHTVCEWRDPPDRHAVTWRTKLTCQNIYTDNDGNIVRGTDVTTPVYLAITDKDQLVVRVGLDSREIAYSRCDHKPFHGQP